MDEKPRFRWWTLLLVPLVVLAVIPVAFLLAIAVYVRAALIGIWHLVFHWEGKRLPSPKTHQKPHFLEARVRIPSDHN